MSDLFVFISAFSALIINILLNYIFFIYFHQGGEENRRLRIREIKQTCVDNNRQQQLHSLSSAEFRTAKNGNQLLVFDGHSFHRNNSCGAQVYWRCAHARRLRCRARIVTNGTELLVKQSSHTHEPLHCRLQYGHGINSVRRLIKNRRSIMEK